MKKLLAVLLTVAMLMATGAVAAFAADEPFTIAASSAEGRQGDTVKVTVSLANNPGIWGLDAVIKYDGDVLKLIDVKNGDIFGDSHLLIVDADADTEGMQYQNPVKLSYDLDPDLINITTNGTLATLTFSIVKGLPYGGSGLIEFVTTGETNKTYAIDLDENDVPLTVTNGEVVRLPENMTGVTMSGAEYPYDGTLKSLTVAGAPEGASSVTYFYDGVAADGKTDAGEYTVTATVSATGYNDYTVPAAKLTIKPKELTLVALDVDAKTCTFDGVVSGDEAKVTLDFDQIKVEKVGDNWQASNFVLTGEGKDNYTLLPADPVVFTPAEENIVTVTVKSVLEDGTAVPDKVYEFYKGQASELTAEEISKYTFAGWYKGDVLVSDDAAYSFTADENLELEARYAKDNNSAWIAILVANKNKKYTVSYNSVGGSRVDSQSVKKNECATMPAAPTKGQDVFAGWYTGMSYATKFDFNTAITKDMTLFAKWVTKEQCIVMTIDSTDATVFGKAAKTDVAPIIVNDRTMLPARFVAEALGAKVEWNAAARKATITGNGTVIEIFIDSTTAYVNGKAVTLDSPAFIRGDRTYTPVRFVAEALGATVTWDAAARQALITK